MTDQKLLEVIDRYELRLDGVTGANEHVLHVAEMLPQMREMVAAQRREKLMRWLGWVQAVLVVHGLYSLEEVKGHNMPDDQRRTRTGDEGIRA